MITLVWTSNRKWTSLVSNLETGKRIISRLHGDSNKMNFGLFQLYKNGIFGVYSDTKPEVILSSLV